MAGGSHIIISADGIQIKTSGSFKVHAGQHQFVAGQPVAQPQTALPNPVSDFSNQFDYSTASTSWCHEHSWHAFVIAKDTGKLLANDRATEAQQLNCQRFYSNDPQAVIGILALSDQIVAHQALPNSISTTHDPLLAELLAVDRHNLQDQDPVTE